jgi:hypothetical protein
MEIFLYEFNEIVHYCFTVCSKNPPDIDRRIACDCNVGSAMQTGRLFLTYSHRGCTRKVSFLAQPHYLRIILSHKE